MSAEKVASENKASAEEVAEDNDEDNASNENPYAEEAKESETAEQATEPDDLIKKDTEKVEDLKDEVCPDDIYRNKPEQLKSNRSLPESKSTITSVDYYSLTYEDMPDPDWTSESASFFSSLVSFQNM